jgi:hypothetical protein
MPLKKPHMPIAPSMSKVRSFASSGLEYWSGGVMGSIPNTPLLQHSIPFARLDSEIF